nr:hypothetical protein EP46_21690 [Pantoea sp. 3.5.1]
MTVLTDYRLAEAAKNRPSSIKNRQWPAEAPFATPAGLILSIVHRSKKAIIAPGMTGPVQHAGPVSEK